jgi:prolipoprotein diacylglyceryltransferase
MVVATIIGARLGHVIFYEPERFLENPIDIIKVWEGGLASHGAAIAILIALWIYSRKNKPGQNYLQTLDRIVILVALVSALIRFGNYFNSEIIGKPTNQKWGIVFVNPLTSAITNKQIDTSEIVDFVTYEKNENIPGPGIGLKPITIYLFFKPNATAEQIEYLINDKIKNLLTDQVTEYFYERNPAELDYKIARQADGTYGARISTFGIARHPTQLYECFTYTILFLLLLSIWSRYKANLPAGRTLGVFLIVCFGSRFLFEFLKEPQVDFEHDMFFNMGQLLSIPLIVAGIVILIWSFLNRPEQPQHKR